MKIFSDCDLSEFWDDSLFALKSYVEEPPTDKLIAEIEVEIGGYKLPAAYIELMKMHNGGIPNNCCYPTDEPSGWAEDHVALTGIMGIGRKKTYSLCGELGSNFMKEEWGYPDIGVCFADTPTAGHTMFMFDYRKCGKTGEPEVVHVDQECDYEIQFIAENFETFIRGLVSEEVFDTSEEDMQDDLEKVATDKFSDDLANLCHEYAEVSDVEEKIRTICTQIVNEKGHFSLHADELSMLMYDILFILYTNSKPVFRDEYLENYSKLIVFGGEFSTGGYAPCFIADWLDNRIKLQMIVEEAGKYHMTKESRLKIIEKMNEF